MNYVNSQLHFSQHNSFYCRAIESNLGVEILRGTGGHQSDDEDDIEDETDRFN